MGFCVKMLIVIGLGGTSLLNANVFLEADEDTLNMKEWPKEIREESLKPCKRFSSWCLTNIDMNQIMSEQRRFFNLNNILKIGRVYQSLTSLKSNLKLWDSMRIFVESDRQLDSSTALIVLG